MTMTLRRRSFYRHAPHTFLALFILVLSLFHPTQAQAFTWKKDGVTSIGAADCIIVADFRNPSSVSLGSSFRREGNNLYAVYKAPDGGGTWDIDGSILLTYKKGLLDNRGAYHTLYVKITNVDGVWKKGLTTSRGKKTVRQLIGTLAQNWIGLESYATKITYGGKSLHDKSSSTGLHCRIYAWTDAAGAGLAYNLLVKDIDQPSYIVSPSAYTGSWRERVGLKSTELKGTTVHVEKNTYLTYNDEIIVGTKSSSSSVTGSVYTAGFSAQLTLTGSELSGNPAKGFAIGWSGSRCQTRIFEDIAHAIVTKAGKGGACHQVAGTNAAASPIALSQKSVSDGVFVTRTDLKAVPKNNYVVTVTPKAGYEIDKVTLDGKQITVSKRTGMSVPIKSIVADHVVTATFRALPDAPAPQPEPEPGSLILQKESAHPDITNGNTCYTLGGAQYDVFADEECTELVTSLFTNADGISQRVSLEAATYYIRESVPSPGFRLDEATYAVEIREGEEYRLKVFEEPVTSEFGLEVQKLDADLGTPEPQGSASLEGALFSVSFYDGLYASSDELPSAPTRSWMLTTDQAGHTIFDDAHLASGDEPYRDDEGNFRLPLGTILVREEQPPRGYNLPATPLALFAHIVQEDDVIQVEPVIGPASLELEMREPVLRGGLRLKKVDNDQNPLAGAVFSLTNTSAHPVMIDGTTYQPGEVCLTMETDSNGIATTSDSCLPFGTYDVHEQRAPQGFCTNSSWQKQVEIAEEGRIVDLTGEPLANEPLTIDVILTARKNFDGSSQDRELLPEMFSFTLSNEDGEIIGTATNDKEGTVTFDPLTFRYEDIGADHRYTIAEVAGDDEEIIYDTHTEEVSIRITEQNDGALSAEVLTDDDGVVFENHTVERLSLPMTGQTGIHTKGVATLGAIAFAFWESRRRRGVR